jgi:hypothetical protein
VATQPSGPSPEIAARLKQLRDELAVKAEMDRRRQQAVINLEKTAGPVKLLTDKANGGLAHMADGGKYKSVLETYNESRQPKVDDQPLEGVYPETWFNPRTLLGLTSTVNLGAKGMAARNVPRPNVQIGSKAKPVDWEEEARLLKELRETDWSKTPWKQNPFEETPEWKEAIAKRAKERAVKMFKKDLKNKAELSSVRASANTGADIGTNEDIDTKYNPMGDSYAKGGPVEPKKTVKAYKLFRVHPKHPGKLFPLFVNANEPVEMGKWQDAQIGEMTGNKVKSKIGPLAFRPGWHAGDVPVATHIGEKSDPNLTAPDVRPDNHVWAEVEMPDDVDWQSEANKRGTNAQGRVVPVKAHITDQIPTGGHYRYKTNSNMTGNWLIGGSMKVNRVLDDKEVRSINKAAGVADLPRAKPFKKKDFGFAGGGTVAPDEWKAEEHVNHARGGKVTHAHHLEIEERPL